MSEPGSGPSAAELGITLPQEEVGTKPEAEAPIDSVITPLARELTELAQSGVPKEQFCLTLIEKMYTLVQANTTVEGRMPYEVEHAMYDVYPLAVKAWYSANTEGVRPEMAEAIVLIAENYRKCKQEERKLSNEIIDKKITAGERLTGMEAQVAFNTAAKKVRQPLIESGRIQDLVFKTETQTAAFVACQEKFRQLRAKVLELMTKTTNPYRAAKVLKTEGEHITDEWEAQNTVITNELYTALESLYDVDTYNTWLKATKKENVNGVRHTLGTSNGALSFYTKQKMNGPPNLATASVLESPLRYMYTEAYLLTATEEERKLYHANDEEFFRMDQMTGPNFPLVPPEEYQAKKAEVYRAWGIEG